jgi:type IV pilus biogenesis protein CpaD/CtpE
VEAITPEETAPVDALRISSQSWRRGGLGSKALVTLTLRNGNEYAVKDIEIACAFARRDGSHLTDRTRVIHDTVNMKSRKTFARLHVGFVNINANKAKCALVAASHI